MARSWRNLRPVIRAELYDSHCVGCGASLARAASVERKNVTYTAGEFAGERGTVIVAECACGLITEIPFSVDLGRAACSRGVVEAAENPTMAGRGDL